MGLFDMCVQLVHQVQRTFPSANSPIVQLSMFHNKTGPIWLTLKKITDDLKKNKIDHTVIGGIAVYQHGYERSTRDCDLLLTKAVNIVHLSLLIHIHINESYLGF